MSIPRVKRPFAGAASDPSQRPITTFFGRDAEATAYYASTRSHGSTGSPAPPLPPSVQADLLAVGMRVRKSVPEGYKTGKGNHGTGRWPEPRKQKEHKAHKGQEETRPQLAALPARELLPFCGIHRIGGLGVQSFDDERPLFPAALFAAVDQCDVAPTDEAASMRKRQYSSHDDDDDAETPAAFYQLGRRVLAVPRRRQPQSQPQGMPFSKIDGRPVRMLDQENGGAAVADDFDEAAFLDASARGGDQEMGGM